MRVLKGTLQVKPEKYKYRAACQNELYNMSPPGTTSVLSIYLGNDQRLSLIQFPPQKRDHCLGALRLMDRGDPRVWSPRVRHRGAQQTWVR